MHYRREARRESLPLLAYGLEVVERCGQNKVGVARRDALDSARSRRGLEDFNSEAVLREQTVRRRR